MESVIISSNLYEVYMASSFIIRYVTLLVGYILCYVYWWLPTSNTDLITTAIFMLLQVITLISTNIENDHHLIVISSPFPRVNIRSIFLLGWGLLFTATAILIYAFKRLHLIFSASGKQVQYGSNGNKNKLNAVKRLLTGTSIMLLIMYLLMVQKEEKYYKIVNFVGNNVIIVFYLSFLIMGSFSVYLTNEFESTMRVISSQ